MLSIKNKWTAFGAIDGIAIALSFTLRYKAFAFLRWLPWGNRVVEDIYLCWTLFLVAWLLQFMLHRRTTSKCVGSADISNQGYWTRLALAVGLGRYDAKSRSASFASLFTNSLVTFMVIDFIYRARIFHESSSVSFSRMGYVDASSAKVVVRYPVADYVEIQCCQTWDAMPCTADSWKKGPTTVASPEEDYVITFELSDLSPGSHYNYRTNASHAGSFSTPTAYPKHWSLVSSSCIKPFFPYKPFDHSLSMKGFSYLSDHLRESKVDMILFLGDFIYIDLPKRFGYNVEDYREAYRQVYASPEWTDELRNTPWIHAYDDHEITNNWSSNETGIYQQAMSPYVAYHHNGNPKAANEKATYYTFTRGDVSFFLADTRRYRSPGDMPDGRNKTMLGLEQLQALKAWLRTGTGWKVLVSSVPFTRNFQAHDSEDSWTGYLWERQVILELMWETDGVLILSGDRHEHATTSFPQPGKNDSKVIEFSTSPLNQFVHPFAMDYSQAGDSDVPLYYHHWGTSKFGIFTFDTSDPQVWKMDFSLMVDGVKAWNHSVRQLKGFAKVEYM